MNMNLVQRLFSLLIIVLLVGCTPKIIIETTDVNGVTTKTKHTQTTYLASLKGFDDQREPIMEICVFAPTLELMKECFREATLQVAFIELGDDPKTDFEAAMRSVTATEAQRQETVRSSIRAGIFALPYLGLAGIGGHDSGDKNSNNTIYNGSASNTQSASVNGGGEPPVGAVPGEASDAKASQVFVFGDKNVVGGATNTFNPETASDFGQVFDSINDSGRANSGEGDNSLTGF